MSKQTRDLERTAVDAHRRGLAWSEFWDQHGAAVCAAEPWDRRRFHKLVRRLVSLVAAGNMDGAELAGDGWPRPQWSDRHAPSVPRG